MGISQHVHGTDNARCLIALAMVTGQVGRPGTGLHPLRGQNNVQGASDAGLIPMVYPDYQSVANPDDPREIRGAVADRARRQARADRGRDHGRGPSRRDQGHVHHGREPGDVRPRCPARPRRAGPSRTSRRAGHLPDRDREIRRCGAAGLGLAGEGRHRLQHQPPGADRPPRIADAGECARGSVDHPGDRPADRARLVATAIRATCSPR